MKETIYSISLPYATFALVVVDGKVIDCPPIVKWAKGKRIEGVVKYYQGKGATITEVARLDEKE